MSGQSQDGWSIAVEQELEKFAVNRNAVDGVIYTKTCHGRRVFVFRVVPGLFASDMWHYVVQGEMSGVAMSEDGAKSQAEHYAR